MTAAARPTGVIYLDHCATTPCLPEVVDAMRPYMDREFGNPSSAHVMGRRARHAIEQATQQVASLIGARPEEIVFTSGATEANNIALFSSFAHDERAPAGALLCPIDHKSTLDVGKELKRRGLAIDYLPVAASGRVKPEDVMAALTAATRIVSLAHVNSELGTIQPVDGIGRVTQQSGTWLHVDAVQSVGKLPMDVKACGIDMLSLSAHKLRGPKGVGALFVDAGVAPRLRPFIFGGGQNRLRSGTLPTPLIVGFGLACEMAQSTLALRHQKAVALRSHFIARLRQSVPDAVLNTDVSCSSPYIVNVRFGDIASEALVSGLHQVAISSGSACNSAELKPSHALTGVGLSADQARASVRFCLDPDLDTETLDVAIGYLAFRLNSLRQEHYA
ncbi:MULTISPECIES: cysteine desulfurase family protein [Ralstonia solanacearum species complex]|uniref:cysteine desulfurase n=2 Tax=Ralstonia solanacearum TaxID=305 RepID=A0A7U7PQC7_RALSL|nr:cysteine desulfurase family protein [Ralstonia solanacearum]ALF91018.1 Cysteine desulfurase IscS [Ralstonia solanacearum]ATI30421.1 aminotransferase class V-fold PLP-dependent enzyme [Ralstonia solanacearum]EAP74099.1 Cysteine desulfurase [Ralstonia solanacearum UW551]KEI31132.1 NIFS-like protein [Ralstonia solanacearum]KFX81787.1 NIFS-like protein [Ralstonia solanacearum]